MHLSNPVYNSRAGQLKAPASVAGLKDWQPMIQRKFVAGVGGKDVCGTTLSEPGEILHWSVPNTLRDRFGLTPSTVGEACHAGCSGCVKVEPSTEDLASGRAARFWFGRLVRTTSLLSGPQGCFGELNGCSSQRACSLQHVFAAH